MISERIKVIRAARNKTMADMADICGCTAQLICKWEAGTSHPNSSALLAIAKELDCSLEWLLDATPLDFHSTGTAPQGKHAKYWVRAVLDELAEQRAALVQP
jgi:transcriptional regulator with XRE-family HTH domain